jgi:hypothetical protein
MRLDVELAPVCPPNLAAPAPAPEPAPAAAAGAGAAAQPSSSGGGGASTGTIVGAVVGGVVGAAALLAAAAGLVALLVRRRRRRRAAAAAAAPAGKPSQRPFVADAEGDEESGFTFPLGPGAPRGGGALAATRTSGPSPDVSSVLASMRSNCPKYLGGFSMAGGAEPGLERSGSTLFSGQVALSDWEIDPRGALVSVLLFWGLPRSRLHCRSRGRRWAALLGTE